jgi:hypothetical protein
MDPTKPHTLTTDASTHQTRVDFWPDLSLDRPIKPTPDGPMLDILRDGSLLLWAWVSGHRLPILIGWIHDGRERTGMGGGDLELAVVRLAVTREREKIYKREGENLHVFNFFIEKVM